MEDAGRIPAIERDKDDCRVNVKSKKIVAYQLTKYKSLLKTLLDGQSQLSEEDKEKLLQETLTNFELAVQENVLVDRLPWEEAPEEDSEDSGCSSLDDMLDEKIVQTTWKRSVYPKKILPYVVRSLKAERKLMGLFENAVQPAEVKRDTSQDTIMSNISTAVPKTFKQASTVIKSLKALKQAAEGLHEVLNMQYSAETLEAHRDVFGISNGKGAVPAERKFMARTLKHDVTEKFYSMSYAAQKISTTSAESD